MDGDDRQPPSEPESQQPSEQESPKDSSAAKFFEALTLAQAGASGNAVDYSAPYLAPGIHRFGEHNTPVPVGRWGRPSHRVLPGPTNPNIAARYAQVVGPVTDAAKDFPFQIEGVKSPAEALMAISYWEGDHWNANAYNEDSKAEGLFQFIPRTKADTEAKMEQASLLNPDMSAIEVQARMGAYFAQQNTKWLQDHGHPVTLRNLYLTHWFGKGGANRLLHAEGSDLIADVLPELGEKGLISNGFNESTTVSQVFGRADDIMATSLTMTRKYAGLPTPQAPSRMAADPAVPENTLTYYVSTGQFVNARTGEVIFSGANSGLGEMMNNPTYEDRRGHGPIPAGTYILGAYDRGHLGGRHLSIALYADPGKIHGRDGILIHEQLHAGGGSEGCIALPRGDGANLAWMANYINEQGIKYLQVRSDMPVPAPSPVREAAFHSPGQAPSAPSPRDVAANADLAQLKGLVFAALDKIEQLEGKLALNGSETKTAANNDSKKTDAVHNNYASIKGPGAEERVASNNPMGPDKGPGRTNALGNNVA